MLNKYLTSSFNTTLFGDNMNTSDTNTNNTTSTASLTGRQHALTNRCDQNNVSVTNNNNELCYVLEQENIIINMKINKNPRPADI